MLWHLGDDGANALGEPDGQRLPRPEGRIGEDFPQGRAGRREGQRVPGERAPIPPTSASCQNVLAITGAATSALTP
jgi:hypothetical protein